MDTSLKHINFLIILYDDYCYLCSNTIRVLLWLDQKKKIKFCGLSSEIAKEFLENTSTEFLHTDSLRVYKNENLFLKSSAVYQILKTLSGRWNIFKILTIIPTKYWNVLYDLIAKYRFKLLGKRKQCYIIPKKYQDRVLDY